MSDDQNPKFRDVLTRMRKIEGQARGISRMMEEERYCVDILQQILALEAAARAAKTKVLDIHTKHCIELLQPQTVLVVRNHLGRWRIW